MADADDREKIGMAESSESNSAAERAVWTPRSTVFRVLCYDQLIHLLIL